MSECTYCDGAGNVRGVPCKPCDRTGRADALAGLSFGLIEHKPRGMDDPDYARIFTQARIIAWQHGFALIHHGSLTRDLDLLMVPWEERAYDKIVPAVINRIAKVTDTSVKGEPSEKPHGRKAYTLFLPDMVRWVDLSVMPCIAAASLSPGQQEDPGK